MYAKLFSIAALWSDDEDDDEGKNLIY
jgi:hypothetical protein